MAVPARVATRTASWLIGMVSCAFMALEVLASVTASDRRRQNTSPLHEAGHLIAQRADLSLARGGDQEAREVPSSHWRIVTWGSPAPRSASSVASSSTSP